MSVPTYRTLCSGGELFGCGARSAGWVHVDGYELRDKIAAVARQNGFTVHAADVCAVDFAALAPAWHLHISPSCKTASRAANGQETAADLAVADATCRAIRAHAAQGGRSVSLENVVGYRWYASYDRICQTLADCGFVFEVVTKGGERPAWRQDVPQWNDAGLFVDAADFGVPQNRKRLILRAVHRAQRERVPGLRPTHGARGGVLLERWRGWLAAITDLVPTLPPTTPAPWMLARMPAELRETLLFQSRLSHDHQGNAYEGVRSREAEQPAGTIGTHTAGWYRAFLVPGENAGGEWGKGYREDGEPAQTVNQGGGTYPRAYIVGGGNTQLDNPESRARPDDLPMFTVSASDGARKVAAAYLIGDQSGSAGTGLQLIADDEPAFTLRAGRGGGCPRAVLAGAWRALTVQALGRFQTVPDDYIGLTAEINGNGVPCLLAQRIMESLL